MVTLINIVSVKPGVQQSDVIDSLRKNTDTVIKSLKGWQSTSIIASHDGQRVVIHSEWDSEADVSAMRSDPRMQAYFPKISELASFDSTVGTKVL